MRRLARRRGVLVKACAILGALAGFVYGHVAAADGIRAYRRAHPDRMIYGNMAMPYTTGGLLLGLGAGAAAGQLLAFLLIRRSP